MNTELGFINTHVCTNIYVNFIKTDGKCQFDISPTELTNCQTYPYMCVRVQIKILLTLIVQKLIYLFKQENSKIK